jgi:hypothetical protein
MLLLRDGFIIEKSGVLEELGRYESLNLGRAE